jgi:hypothetical protein
LFLHFLCFVVNTHKGKICLCVIGLLPATYIYYRFIYFCKKRISNK